MNLIVVDDNNVELREICKMIESMGLDIHISGVFCNGKEAYEFLKEQEVDIIISDIQMPVMDGIELIKALKTDKHMAEVIFVSCYDDFDCIKEAFKNEAFDYILKPIVKTDFKLTIANAYERYITSKNVIKCREEIFDNMDILKPMIRDEYYRQCLTDENVGKENRAKLQNIIGISSKLQCMTVAKAKIRKDSCIEEDDFFYAALLSIKRMAEELATEDVEVYSMIQEGETVVVILFSDSEEIDVVEIIACLKTNLWENLGIDVSFGISDREYGHEKLSLLNKQANEALGYTFSGKKSSIMLYSDIEELDNNNRQVDIDDMLHSVKRIIERGKKEAIHTLIEEYFDNSCLYNEQYARRVTSYMIYTLELVMVEYNKSINAVLDNAVLEKIQRFDTIIDLSTWLYNIFAAAIDLVHAETEEGESTKQKIVNDVKTIVADRCNTRITVNAIAEELHFSAKYISVIFQELEGKTIFEYITEYKIELAKSLLRQPDSKIYMVAEAVGYTSKSHFYDAFRSYVGISPKEYKNIFAASK